MFPTVNKPPDILVFIGVLECAKAISHIFFKFSSISASVTIRNFPLSISQVVFEEAFIDIAKNVNKYSFPMLLPIQPFPFIFFLLIRDLIGSLTMLEILMPLSEIETAIRVVEDAFALFQSIGELSLIRVT